MITCIPLQTPKIGILFLIPKLISLTSFDNLIFVKYDLRGIDFSEANLRAAIFNNSQLQGADMRGADIEDAVAFATDFEGADLRNVDFTGALLMESTFTNALIDGADFTDAVISRIQQKELCSMASGTNSKTNESTSYSLGC